MLNRSRVQPFYMRFKYRKSWRFDSFSLFRIFKRRNKHTIVWKTSASTTAYNRILFRLESFFLGAGEEEGAYRHAVQPRQARIQNAKDLVLKTSLKWCSCHMGGMPPQPILTGKIWLKDRKLLKDKVPFRDPTLQKFRPTFPRPHPSRTWLVTFSVEQLARTRSFIGRVQFQDSNKAMFYS